MTHFSVPSDRVGQRLDHFLKTYLADESRARVQQWIKDGHIKRILDDQELTVSANYKIKEGDVFILEIPEPLETNIVPQPIHLDIVYEDDDLLVVNKPQGMVVHPAPGHYTDTLVNALLHHCKGTLSGIGGVKRPGIVHRLDKDTSGLMVVAKNDATHQGLSLQFHPDHDDDCDDDLMHSINLDDPTKKILQRRYKALVFNRLPQKQMMIQSMIGRHPTNRQKMAIVPDHAKRGKLAITYLSQDQLWNINNGKLYLSLLDCRLGTGRTHQIRVHCQSILCPLVGDPLYGKSSYHHKKDLPLSIQQFKRQALHAYELSFIHPKTKQSLTFSCPIPKDMQQLIDDLNHPQQDD